MTAPWEADRPLSAESVAAAIRSRFPNVDVTSLKFLGSGWEFDAWRSSDGWVFRFPRRAECAALFAQERRVHDLASRFLSPDVAIPRVELLLESADGFPYPIAAHRFIPGLASDEVDERHLPSLARHIATALGSIHSIPIEAARAAGVEEMKADEEGRSVWVGQRLEVLSSLGSIDPVVDRAADWTRQVSLPIAMPESPLRFIHHDLSPEHLLVDPESGHLNGILDWTDAILGDAARDLVFLVAWRGWEYAEEVLRHYPHPVDPGFRDRLRFMARFLTVMWLALAHERGTEFAKLTTWVHNAYAPAVHTIQPRRR